MFELRCFTELHHEDASDRNKQALFTSSAANLWAPGQELKVSFDHKKKIPAVWFRNNYITTKDLIDWMNEWSAGESCVPTFREVERFEDGDIRVKFGGTCNLVLHNTHTSNIFCVIGVSAMSTVCSKV